VDFGIFNNSALFLWSNKIFDIKNPLSTKKIVTPIDPFGILLIILVDDIQ
jgi:hypothetical protein